MFPSSKIHVYDMSDLSVTARWTFFTSWWGQWGSLKKDTIHLTYYEEKKHTIYGSKDFFVGREAPFLLQALEVILAGQTVGHYAARYSVEAVLHTPASHAAKESNLGS